MSEVWEKVKDLAGNRVVQFGLAFALGWFVATISMAG